MKWISVKDALPPFEKNVIVYSHIREISCAQLRERKDGIEWIYVCNCEAGWVCSSPEEGGIVVTHWMPLPEPPEKE